MSFVNHWQNKHLQVFKMFHLSSQFWIYKDYLGRLIIHIQIIKLLIWDYLFAFKIYICGDLCDL